MVEYLKERQRQYDKCMAQSAQFKWQCPSKCHAHNLLQRLLKKLGEHHFLALLCEPKHLESEPEPLALKKIFERQKLNKAATVSPIKRFSNIPNGHERAKKPRNSVVPILPKQTNGFSRSSNTPSILSDLLSGSSQPSLRNVIPQPPQPPIPQDVKSSTPCLVPQGVPENVQPIQNYKLELRTNGYCPFFAKEGTCKVIPPILNRKYEITQF
jgi:hypothetical protein